MPTYFLSGDPFTEEFYVGPFTNRADAEIIQKLFRKYGTDFFNSITFQTYPEMRRMQIRETWRMFGTNFTLHERTQKMAFKEL